MSESETSLMHRIALACTEVGARLFRNQVGKAWVGRVQRCKMSAMYLCHEGDVILSNARMLTTGLGTGSSDYVGYTKKLVTPEMIGTIVAVFTAIEVKIPGGKVEGEQRHFCDEVKRNGGIAAIVDNPLAAGDAIILFRSSGIRS